MSNDWASFRFNSNDTPSKIAERANPPVKKKFVRDMKRGDKVKLLSSGEVFEMTSVEVMSDRFFAVNVENESDRRMLKASDVECLE